MTTTKTATLQEVLEEANPNTLADAMRKVGGKKFATVKVTVAALVAAASFDITSAAFKAAITSLLGITLENGENLPPIGNVATLRVTAGAAAAGHRDVTDVGGTPAATIATISDDGKTLTFEANVTAFVLTYEPREATALTDVFAPVG